MAWTKQQKQAIEKKGANILVSAAAGSGKTSVLVERIINKIVNQDVDIDKILVVTFTNAAASEMKQRILNALYTKIDEKPEDENLQKQVSLINRAKISTIHSFCLDVIRNNFFELGIPANFRVGDDTEIEIMKQEVIEKIFEDKYESQDKDFINLLNLYTSYRDDMPLKEIILETYRFSMCVPFPEKWLEEAIERFNIKDVNDMTDFSETIWGKIILKDAKDKLEDYILNLKTEVNVIKNYENLANNYELIVDDLNDLESMKFENWDKTYNQVTLKEWNPWTSKRNLNEEEKEVKEHALTVRNEAKEYFKKNFPKTFAYKSKDAFCDIKQMYPVLIALKNITLEFAEEFTKKKREKNVVDFSDIEHLALKLLINKDGTKSEIAKKYNFEEILIDEYQDSNLVQEKILNSVSNGKNIFMVGDMKQSIYRFRQARPDLFLNKYDSYQKIDEDLDKSENILQENTKIQLYNNFRSRKNVLDFTNSIFQNVMSRDLGEINYTKEEYLNYSADFAEPKIDCKTEVYVIDTDEHQEENISTIENSKEIDKIMDKGDIDNSNENQDDDSEDDEKIVKNAELEARLVAIKIKELVSHQNIKYKDIAILLRSPKSVAAIYEKKLIEEEIPVFSDVSTGYLSTIEINTIISLLKIIDNPLQDIPFVTVLRSPIGGFTDNDLIEIRLLNKDGLFYEALKLSQSEKAKNFLAMLDNFRKAEKELPLNELIWKIYSDTGYYHYVRLMPNGNLRQANLRKLFEKAKDYEQISFKGLFNFIIFIEKVASQASNNMLEAKIIGENDDVVRIMSIHKSKGLEFPVVILCGISKRFNQTDLAEKILYHQDLGLGINYIKDGVEYPTLSKEALKIVMRKEEISEEMRIFYVALTRAKEKLILVGIDKNAKKNLDKKKIEIEKYKNDNNEKINSKLVGKYIRFLDWIELIYQKEKNPDFEFNIIEKSSLKDSTERQEDYSIKECLKEHEINSEKYNKIDSLLNWKYKYEDAVEIPSKTSVTALKREQFEQSIAQDKKMNKQDLIQEKNDEKIATENNINSVIIQEGAQANSYEDKKIEAKQLEDKSENEKLTSAQKGTLVHLALQKIVISKDEKNEKTKEQILKDLVERLNINEVEKSELEKSKSIFYDYMNSNIYKDLANAKQIYRETPFYMNLKYKDTDENILIQGVIDLYYINENDELILVDYKTDNVISELELKEKYKLQLDLYKQALEKSLKRKVDKVYIYSTKLAKGIEICQIIKNGIK